MRVYNIFFLAGKHRRASLPVLTNDANTGVVLMPRATPPGRLHRRAAKWRYGQPNWRSQFHLIGPMMAMQKLPSDFKLRISKASAASSKARPVSARGGDLFRASLAAKVRRRSRARNDEAARRAVRRANCEK